jgi:hypothetical protein
MVVCPGCQEFLPTPAGPDELCAKCTAALETGVDNSSPVAAAAQPVPRPLGVMILALQKYLIAVCCIVGGAGLLIKSSVSLAIIAFLVAWVFYAVGSGLWRLKDWARWIVIVLFLVDMLSGEPSLIFPLSWLLGGGPIVVIAGRVLTVLIIAYLLRPHMDMAFGVATLARKWQLAVIAVVLVCFVVPLTQARPEFRAIQWHLRHGNRITVNGVSFPVHLWHVPAESCDETGFKIDDEPGPLRPREQLSFVRVDGCKDAERTATPAELADERYKSDQKAGYFDVRKYQMRVRGQTLECMQSDIGSVTHRIDCSGEGPIYSVFFSGNGDVSLDRFNHMMADAR